MKAQKLNSYTPIILLTEKTSPIRPKEWFPVTFLPFLREHSTFHLVDVYTLSKIKQGASLVAQWLRICLPMQGTRVRALVWEDPTCHGAAGPVSHNC